MALDKQASGLTVMRVCLGVFLVAVSLGKLSWLTSPATLSATLAGWLKTAAPLSRWYLENVAIPWTGVFARLVMLGEFGCGLALILGFYTRVFALVAFLMVLNFHFASSLIFQGAFLSAPQGLPVLGALFALALGGVRLPMSLRR